MATFKVGQRVRVIRSNFGYEGKEATVIGDGRAFYDLTNGEHRYGWPIEIDGVGTHCQLGRRFHGVIGWIVPLTDPGVDAFLARIKKLGSEPVNEAPKVTVREGK